MLTRLPFTVTWPWFTNWRAANDGRHELRAVDDRVEAALQQADQVLAGVAAQPLGLGVDAAELLLGQVAVVALELLLGAQLRAEVADSLPLRRWPCWPGPYSRRFTGDFGRPQMFSPMRRSILYFAVVRLVTWMVLSSSQYRRRPPLPGRPGRQASPCGVHERQSPAAPTGPRKRPYSGWRRGVNADGHAR